MKRLRSYKQIEIKGKSHGCTLKAWIQRQCKSCGRFLSKARRQAKYCLLCSYKAKLKRNSKYDIKAYRHRKGISKRYYKCKGEG
jgi:methionyl-tRNA synthetase